MATSQNSGKNNKKWYALSSRSRNEGLAATMPGAVGN
jgi:hypothetical protein